MKLVILNDYDSLSKWAACYVADKIRCFYESNEGSFVLGLPTGSTPVGMYSELSKMVSERKLSFERVITFNMDEYIGLNEAHSQSYHYFMHENLFSQIDINQACINIPDGMASDLDKECINYENKIRNAGGINLFVGGIGSNGHIAFNEPGSSLFSRTRVVNLTEKTIADNSRFFENNPEKVPQKALTVGIGTIMESKSLLFLASGRNKAIALKKGIEEGINHLCPFSVLQLHADATIVCDEDAASGLNSDVKKHLS